MAAAIQLRKQALDVDVVEIDPGWRSTVPASALAAPRCAPSRRWASCRNSLNAARPTTASTFSCRTVPGRHLAHAAHRRSRRAGGGAIMRPVLAKILAEATVASGANVRLGCTFTALRQHGDGVEVTSPTAAPSTTTW
jgi:2-polyprenyl-6-methoxyphenol hydroxylase-like FAD-dependent oxidoreductase